MSNAIAPPNSEPISRPIGAGSSEDYDGFVSDAWLRYFVALAQAVNDSPVKTALPIALTAQGAALGTTSLATPQQAAGLYRFTYYARITQAATVNSSLTVTLNWVDHGIAQTFSGAAIVGNTTTSYQTDTLTVYLDALSPITYSTAYASAGATSMTYQLYVVLETVAI